MGEKQSVARRAARGPSVCSLPPFSARPHLSGSCGCFRAENNQDNPGFRLWPEPRACGRSGAT